MQYGMINGYNAAKPDAINSPEGRQSPALTPQQRQEQTQIKQIQSQYADKFSGSGSSGNPNQRAADVLAKVRSESESHIRGHEQAHQSAAGSLGGSMSIQYDQNGVAFAGQVPISIPPLDRNNPAASIKNYQTVRFAALAPADPSGQDMAVASRAQSLMGQAQVLMDQKRQVGSMKARLDPQ